MSTNLTMEPVIHSTVTGRISCTAENYSNTPKPGNQLGTRGTCEFDASDVTKNQRIQKALEIAVRYGGLENPEMKDWTIDQMVRALTGCPLVKRSMFTDKGVPYEIFALGDSAEYQKLVADARAGEDGPETYQWNTGLHPSVLPPETPPYNSL